jgi:peptidoglycan L-alanyl-D-glutamate endopeptidase CwlK
MMDSRSEKNLIGVHPDLVKVVELCAQHCKFIVIDGLRTLAEEQANVAKGASTTLHSRHLPNSKGLACAVDVAAVDENGHITWSAPEYEPIAEMMKAAAVSLDIPIEWGGDWKKFKDLGHFQLPWAQYP